jgi:outer membrane protein OmpA-like peptidoglycan-associated protein
LFDLNSSKIKIEFEQMLLDFFPRYLKILTNKIYKDEIQEVRVEGHTSSIWKGAKSREESYLNNMRLSQNRARKVLNFTYKTTKLGRDRRWLEGHFRANGMSFSKIIKTQGKEDSQASQRVEFKVLTKSEEKINEIINKLQEQTE